MQSDIYFEMQYGKLYEINDIEKIEEYKFECEYGKVDYIFLKRKISSNKENNIYDIVTPYGYGGPYFYGYEEKELIDLEEKFNNAFIKYCIDNNIVSEFVRFHPLYDNYKHMEKYMDVIYLSDTIYMNLQNEEQILAEMDGKTRNMIRKSIKSGVTVEIDIKNDTAGKFMEIYYETMNKNNAADYYFFDNKYFQELFNLGNKKVVLFNAYFENEIISSTTILLGEEFIHYHLSANTELGYKLAANNLLLFEVAKWGAENGYTKFHLGGGYGGNDSPLFKFKKSMAKNNIVKFCIGKRIHNQKKYNILNNEVEEKYPELKNDGSNYFPCYRRK